MPRDTVTVPREVLERAHGHLCKIAGTECWTHNNLDGWQATPGALREYAENAAKELDEALTSSDPEGGARGVQTSIATKQESCPESAPRTETAVREAHPSIPSDGFNCIYLYEDGREVGCLNGPQDDPAVIARANHWTGSLTKTPSAGHDAGNLRGLAEPNSRDSSEFTTGGAE